MSGPSATVQEILRKALEVVQRGDEALYGALDALPAAIYVTDADGVVIYFNPACIDFTGRTPTRGADRWCVTWKLYTTDGEFLPHDRCPMAVAIREKRAIRGVTAVAERPDGTRIDFMPYPTPLLSADGEMLGAVNVLIDVSDVKQAGFLREQAVKCRRLALTVSDPTTTDTLMLMAAEYDVKAAALEMGVPAV